MAQEPTTAPHVSCRPAHAQDPMSAPQGSCHPAMAQDTMSPLGPSAPAPATPQLGQPLAPNSPALPSHGPTEPGPPAGPRPAQPHPAPREVPDAQGWGCPGAWLLAGVGQALAARPCHPGGHLMTPSPRPGCALTDGTLSVMSAAHSIDTACNRQQGYCSFTWVLQYQTNTLLSLPGPIFVAYCCLHGCCAKHSASRVLLTYVQSAVNTLLFFNFD